MSLRVIDVSSYQATLNVQNATDVDGVIIKATEGTGYVNPYCDTHYQQAKAAGKLRGVYHFAGNIVNTAAEEAAYFVDNIRGYIGDAILVLDYENSSTNYQGNVGWALDWLREVERLTGVKPVIYMNASCVNSNDWTRVIANGNALWVAAYQASAPDVNWPNEAQIGWQYTSSARVAGYGSNVDMSTFWVDAAGWGRFASAKTTPVADTPPPVPVTTTTTQASPNPTPEPTTPPPPVTTTTSTQSQSAPSQTPVISPSIPLKLNTWQALWNWILKLLKLK